MRTVCALFAVLVAISLCPSFRADEKAVADSKEGVHQSLAIQDLNVTDEQEAKIADIRKECRPKIAEAAKDLATTVKEEIEKMREVLTVEQKDKLQALKEDRKDHKLESLAQRIAHLKHLELTDTEMTQIEAIGMEYHPKIEEAMKKMSGILTDDQKKSREEALKAGKSRREVRQALNLTDEQKQQVEAVCKDLTPLVREEMEKIRDVLNEEQQAKLSDLKEERKERVRDRMACRIANFADLNLTDEQKTKLADIRGEYRPKVQEAGNKLRAAAREAIEMVVAVLKG